LIWFDFDLIWIHTFLWHWFKLNSWEKLCYVYWMNKTLWERKSLINYIMISHHQNNKKKKIKIKNIVWMTSRRCVMMKRCALIACRVFAIAQTLIISMHMLQAICMQIRKSNRMQNYEKNRLWKSFNSVSHHHDDKNWNRTLSCLICWEWLAERT